MLRSLDLFSGVGGITHALRGLAHPVMYCERDPGSIGTLKALMHAGKIPRAPICDDVQKLNPASVPKIDIIAAGFPCFVAGTLVSTAHGYKAIEDILGSDLLVSHTGALRQIENVQRTLVPAGSTLKHVTITHVASPIVCTEDHPFYTLDRGDIHKDTHKDIHTAPAPAFVAAKDLTSRHVVGMPIDTRADIPIFGNSALDDPTHWKEMGFKIGHSLGSEVKGFPDWVHAAPVHLVSALVEGFLNMVTGTTGTTTIELETVLGVQRLAAKVGILLDPLTLTMCPETTSAFIRDGYVWRAVRRVDDEITLRDQWVYNFQVAINNSYCVCNCAVHNCIGFSTVGKHDGLENEQSSLFAHVVRLARTLQPPILFLENVAAILGNKDYDHIVKQLTKANYDMYWVVLPAFAVGAPQKRLRWFCLCIRRGVTSMRIRPSESYSRHMWTSEPGPRLIPRTTLEATTERRRRLKQLGNSVVPDCVRAAFLTLWTGCTVPLMTLLKQSSKGGPVLTLSPPKALGPLGPLGPLGDSKAYGRVVGGVWSSIPKPPGMLGRPKLGLTLMPGVYKAAKGVRTSDPTSGIMKVPVSIDMWATPRAGNGSVASHFLTKRGLTDLATQLRFEKGTPAQVRKGVTNADWTDWLMGFPRGWTKKSLLKT